MSGTSAKMSPVTTATPSVNASTVQSSPISAVRGIASGLAARSACSPPYARATPATAATNVSTRPSVRSCRNSRRRVAPRAGRTAYSRIRLSARATSRLARFAQAISSTNATAALQHDERLPDAADDVFLQRVHAQPVRLRIGVVGRVRPGRDRLGPFRQHPIDVGERLRMRHAVLPPSDQIEEMAAARRRERRRVDRERLPELDLLIVHVVAARHDADDLVRLVVDLNRLPDDVLAPAVRALPELPREDRDRRRVRHRVGRREPASAQRRHAQRRHQLRRHERSHRPGRL